MIGLAGLATDVQTLFVSLRLCFYERAETFEFKKNMYRMREERDISPKTFAHLVSSTLYEKR